jgi:hypothetical protein
MMACRFCFAAATAGGFMEKETKLGPLARRRPHRMQAEPHHFSRPAHGATVRRPDPPRTLTNLRASE